MRRLGRGENILQADRSHLYQRLVLAEYSHQFVTCLDGTLAVVNMLLAVIWKQRIGAASWLVPAGLAFAMVGLWLFVGWGERRQRTGDPIGTNARWARAAGVGPSTLGRWG